MTAAGARPPKRKNAEGARAMARHHLLGGQDSVTNGPRLPPGEMAALRITWGTRQSTADRAYSYRPGRRMLGF